MRKDILIGSIIAVVIILLAPLSSVVAKSSVDNNELVEFDVELCGLGKKHTVELTPEEADEVELLFDDMQGRLSAVKSDDEAMVIFNEAVVELDKYGLLGGLPIKQAQRLITSPYQSFRDNKFLQRKVNAEKLDDNENYFCLISGKTTETLFFPMPFTLLYSLAYDNDNFDTLLDILYLFFIFFYEKFVTPLIPLKLFTSISFGSYRAFMVEAYYFHSVGEIWTNGINGIKEWKGSFDGGLSFINVCLGGLQNLYYIGVNGFCGLQITANDVAHFLGFANRVKIVYD